jgi:SAM-dependent methyltransferase
LGIYRSIRTYLIANGFSCPDLGSCDSIEQILAVCTARYLTNGLNSLRQVPAHSIDFVWSNAVLEHVRLDEFAALQTELRRILRPGGVCSHQIDLRDHLNMELNHLRFSRSTWESAFFADSGFYTNRLRLPQLLETFENSGFRWRIVRQTRWDRLPINRDALDPEFQVVREDDLRVSGVHVVLW